MKFIDVATIKLFAGKGGDGAVAFHRELYVPKGGPSGGDGGNGGSIIFVGDEGINTLLDLKYQREIKAADGKNGIIKNMHGKNASNKYIRVPLGTLIYNNQTNEIIIDITNNQQKHVLVKGGQGGRGNARFANAKNKAPTIFEAGDLGETVEIRCELKVLADVGLVGLPNAGKSTLLAKISKAKPQIADYPFTTLTPHLGVVRDQNQYIFVVADLPGLIAGAAAGKGLGHDFLRNIERCKLIAHVLDMSGNYGTEDVYQNYLSVKTELKNYNYKLELRSEIIVANKMDIEMATENLVKFKSQMPAVKIIEVSGLMQQNLSLLVNEIGTILTKIKDNKALWQLDEPLVEAGDYKVYTYNNPLETEVEVVNLGNGVLKVSGDAVYKAYHKTPITTYDNLLLFNKKLQDLKVFEILRAKGAKAGDTVRIFDYELKWDG
ncbi:GTPase ObgE [Spiroplasma endosymbiont of Polydrusus formosus]|uniref:GTPase ObgE n=1 Tax=Spiroplasma endosymbiont of Polydrusus formosus TaxID=3139326 RepID=UPI0035B53403